MEQTELLKRIDELEREIALLPSGSIAVKRINDKEYFDREFDRKGRLMFNEKQLFSLFYLIKTTHKQ